MTRRDRPQPRRGGCSPGDRSTARSRRPTATPRRPRPMWQRRKRWRVRPTEPNPAANPAANPTAQSGPAGSHSRRPRRQPPRPSGPPRPGPSAGPRRSAAAALAERDVRSPPDGDDETAASGGTSWGASTTSWVGGARPTAEHCSMIRAVARTPSPAQRSAVATRAPPWSGRLRWRRRLRWAGRDARSRDGSTGRVARRDPGPGPEDSGPGQKAAELARDEHLRPIGRSAPIDTAHLEDTTSNPPEAVRYTSHRQDPAPDDRWWRRRDRRRIEVPKLLVTWPSYVGPILVVAETSQVSRLDGRPHLSQKRHRLGLARHRRRRRRSSATAGQHRDDEDEDPGPQAHALPS